MKEILLLILFCSIGYAALSQTKTEDNQKIVQEYNVVYLHEEDYRGEMYTHGLSDNDLYKYYKKDNVLYPMFSSIEEAMGNMRGYHKRELIEISPIQTIYVLDDYCCGNNAGFPNKIVLYKNNNIEGFK